MAAHLLIGGYASGKRQQELIYWRVACLRYAKQMGALLAVLDGG
jgi:hypothetical protein